VAGTDAAGASPDHRVGRVPADHERTRGRGRGPCGHRWRFSHATPLRRVADGRRSRQRTGSPPGPQGELAHVAVGGLDQRRAPMFARWPDGRIAAGGQQPPGRLGALTPVYAGTGSSRHGGQRDDRRDDFMDARVRAIPRTVVERVSQSRSYRPAHATTPGKHSGASRRRSLMRCLAPGFGWGPPRRQADLGQAGLLHLGLQPVELLDC
jgi:hypothetical protein